MRETRTVEYVKCDLCSHEVSDPDPYWKQVVHNGNVFAELCSHCQEEFARGIRLMVNELGVDIRMEPLDWGENGG